METHPTTAVLCILDGWGHRDEDAPDNAIAQARTPHWDAMRARYPYGVLNASEGEVGLPDGQMGNSEVGHMNIGAGRIVMQDLPRINAAIADGSLRSNPELQDFIAKLKQSGGACHLLGLCSDGGVHAHQDHMLALAHLIAEAGVKVWFHAFLDGRDTPPKSAGGYLQHVQQSIAGQKLIQLATLCGRYYAMDRDQRWDRIKQAYDLLVEAEGALAADAHSAMLHAYEIANTSDEFVTPCVLKGFEGMQDGDGLLMANFRADRAREILQALVDPSFDGFARSRTVSFAATLGMVEYSDALNAYLPCLFAPESLPDGLGEVVSRAGYKQLRIAETEKYAHVTFFMNGGREEPFDGETRVLIPSPDVATYDLKPEMSAHEVTDRLVEAIESRQYALIIVNYANTDMVGHSGKLEAAIQAVEAVDQCLGRLHEAVLKTGAQMLITADHGNAECMADAASGQPHTAHTLNLVPALMVAERYANQPLSVRNGRLADIAPTLLQWLNLPIPAAMSGTPLIQDDTPSCQHAS